MKHLDWVFHDFKLGQIHMDKEYDEFHDGSFRTSGKLKQWCVPLSMRVKTISDQYEYWSDRLHKEGNNSLNYPDIHNWLVNHWFETCQAELDTNEFYRKRYGELTEFCQGILDSCHDFNRKEINGVRIGRGR